MAAGLGCQRPEGVRLKAEKAASTGTPVVSPSAGLAPKHTPAKAAPVVSASLTLMEAVKKGDALAVSGALAAGAPVDGVDEHGGTALLVAAGKGLSAVMPVLIGARANVNHVAEKGWTPLLVAAQQNQPQAAALLLKHGARVNQANDMGETPLHHAAPFPALSRLLLAAGAEIEALDSHGYTPLYVAAAHKSDKSVDLLLKKGADPLFKTPQERTLLHWAAQWGWLKLAGELIRKGADVNAVTRDGLTPLQLATFAENRAMMRLLKQHGATMVGNRPKAPSAP